LLSPASWDDKNDAFFMMQYKQRSGVKSALALCFSEADETYHHWRVFTHGSDGVCIRFQRDKLVKAFAKNTGIKTGLVEYKRIDALEASPPNDLDLPFRKRLPYKDEMEFRIVYIDRKEEVETKGFQISLDCIERITLSPWMPKSLAEAVESTINSIPGCEKINVYRSSLLENERWKRTAISQSGK
jgi:hypothetical protein